MVPRRFPEELHSALEESPVFVKLIRLDKYSATPEILTLETQYFNFSIKL